MTNAKFLSPWRRRFQWASTLAILLFPWLKLNGNSALRIDIPSLSFHFFGQTLRIEELYLLLIASLTLVLVFLLITLVFGRVWCGWACPQTTLNDLAEWLAKKLKLKIVSNRLQGPLWRRLTIQLLYAAIGLLVAVNLLWYFIEPLRFFEALLNTELHWVSWLTLTIVAATIYIDLALIRRLMCSEFCPYGRIQTSLVDPGTLTLHLPDSEKERCIRCHACVRACPMGIDIRDGYQVECINCGRCLDACRQVMVKRRQPGLIRYSFGPDNRGAKALLNPRTLLITTATLSLLVIFGIAISNRAAATLKVAHSHLVAPRILAGGEQATFFNAWVNNRSQEPNTYRIVVEEGQRTPELQIKGQTDNIMVAAGANRRVDFVLVTPATVTERSVQLTLTDENSNPVASAAVLIKATDNDHKE